MFSAGFIKKIFPGANLSSRDFKRIWTDSRSIQAGDLFAAIPGEKFDGHDFILDVQKRGATGAIVSKNDFKGRNDLPKNFDLIEVPDTTEALRQMAKAHRLQLSMPIFAVAGSNGKTTTKEWLGFLLRELHSKENVFKTDKSQNSILGIALSLLQIRTEKFAVIEIGIDEPGWMDLHLEVVAPTHGLITTIAEEHLNRLKNIETVAEEELKLLKFLVKSTGAFAANQDSKWIKDETLPKTFLTYSLDEKSQVEGHFEAPNILHAFGLKWKNPLPGKHNAQNLLAALTAVRLLQPEISREKLSDLVKVTEKFEGEAHRSRLLSLKNEVRVFDDCYNANPDSMEHSLQAFMEISSGCRQHAVLGDMLDLGDASDAAHQRILNLAIVLGIDQIYLFGPQFEAALGRAINKPENIKHFSKIEDLSTGLSSALKPTDYVFLKGSRGMALERVMLSLSLK